MRKVDPILSIWRTVMAVEDKKGDYKSLKMNFLGILNVCTVIRSTVAGIFHSGPKAEDQLADQTSKRSNKSI